MLLDTKQFRQLSDDTMTVGQPPSASDWALGSDNRKYRHATGYGLPLTRLHRGQRPHRREEVAPERLRRLLHADPNLSPTGKHLPRASTARTGSPSHVADGKKTNLTGKLKEKFFDETTTTPARRRRPVSRSGRPTASS